MSFHSPILSPSLNFKLPFSCKTLSNIRQGILIIAQLVVTREWAGITVSQDIKRRDCSHNDLAHTCPIRLQQTASLLSAQCHCESAVNRFGDPKYMMLSAHYSYERFQIVTYTIHLDPPQESSTSGGCSTQLDSHEYVIFLS